MDLRGYDGPRAPTPDEWESVLELSRSIFFPECRHFRDGAVRWPMALHPDFRENLYAIFHEGKPVSAIGRLERDIRVCGHRLRLGYIGGVCTHPDHRKRGLAGAIQNASFRIFREHGVNFVYISGTRPMYYGAGANHIGGFSQITLPPGGIPGPPVALRTAAKADVPLLCRLNERDATRSVRTPLDYDVILTHGHCIGYPCELRIVELQGVPLASLFVGRSEHQGRTCVHVMEVCGDRVAAMMGLDALLWTLGDIPLHVPPQPSRDRAAMLALLDAIPREIAEAGTLQVDVPRGDALGDLLVAHGLTPAPGRSSGTVKLLDYCATMERLRPYFASHLDPGFVASLEFIDADGRYLALSRDGTLTIDGETNLLWTLLGTPAGEERRGVVAAGEMATLLEACLPIPLPSVYLNMI